VGPVLATLLLGLIPQAAGMSEHLVLPGEDGQPLALLERKRTRLACSEAGVAGKADGAQAGMLWEESLLWRGDALRVLATEERRGERLEVVWRELPGERRRGRSWILEQDGPGRAPRVETLGSRRPARHLPRPEAPVVGALELEGLLRAGAEPLGALALVDPVGGPLRTVRVERFTVDEDPFALAAVRAGLEELGRAAPEDAALRGYAWLDQDGRAVRRIVLLGGELLALQLEGRSAWARRTSASRARGLERRLSRQPEVQSR
jgi:hypothetical protein